MSLRPSANPSRPSNLSIRPPSPSSVVPPTISTPINQTSGAAYTGAQILNSPRRAPLPPSPTHSNQGLSGGNAYAAGGQWSGNSYVGINQDDRLRSNSLDVPQASTSTGYFGSRDKRLPAPPWMIPSSPHRSKGASSTGSGIGAYDNKLVSSTLSHLPPLPSPSGSSSHFPQSNLLLLPRPTSPRPSLSTLPSSTSGGVVLPDGTTLSHDSERSSVERRTVADALAHTSPSSPWSVLTVHVLPLFAGGPLKTPIEDLNHLCHSHILAVSQRAATSRIVPALTQDLREFIASGMLTLKAKFETLEEAKIISRAAEVWSFFWSQVLPYLEGVFLPLTQVRDLPSNPLQFSSSSSSTTSTSPPIPVRHLLLSGFMIHILLPLLPRLVPLISASALTPSLLELQRILQMSLVLSTQATYSAIHPNWEKKEGEKDARDEEVRDNVESLGKVVRWRMSNDPASEEAAQQRVQRGQSMSQRRKRATRGSMMPSRGMTMPEEEDYDSTPNQSYAASQAATDWHGGTQATVVA